MGLQMLREAPAETPAQLADRVGLAMARRERWGALRASFAEPRDEVKEFAASMTATYGPAVRVWESMPLDWITALYVVRYGENEAYWPAQLTDDDVVRARQWASDPSKTPQGVRYLPREG